MQKQTAALVIFSLGVFMGALDNGIISAALTTITYAFNISPTWSAWTITIYTLGLAISVPLVGKLSDRFGRKRFFMLEVTLFGLGSMLVAISPTLSLFLFARFVQALGGGGIFILASSYILNNYPLEVQGRALGLIGAMHGIASVLGPNIGAFILSISQGDWHWLFWINVPIAALLLLAGAFFIHEKQALQPARLDVSGLVLLSVATVSIMYGTSQIKGNRVIEMLLSRDFLIFTGIGLALLIVLWQMEKRAQLKGIDPVLPMGQLALGTYRLTLAMGLLSGGILASVIFIPGFIEQVLGVSADHSGYWFTPLAFASGAGAALGGRLVDKKSPTFALSIAAIIALLGYASFAMLVTNLAMMVLFSMVVGIGFGMVIGAPLNVLATRDTPDQKGIALAGLSLARQLGMTVAPTIYAGFLARSFQNLGTNIQDTFQAKGLPTSGIPGMDSFQQAPMAQMMEQGQGAAPPTFESLYDAMERIPSMPVRDALLEALHLTARNGYAGIFWTAAAISIIMFILVLWTAALSNGRKAATHQPIPQTNLQGDPHHP